MGLIEVLLIVLITVDAAGVLILVLQWIFEEMRR